MWTTIYVATNTKLAKKIEKILQDEGFLVKLKSCTIDENDSLFEVAVLEYEAIDAQNVLIEKSIL